jgi:ubiquinone/menaquinone biosynthesis C-methylase UbiE
MRSKVKKEKISEFFASLYYELASLNYQLYIDFAKEISQEFIPDDADLKILDVGAGPGFLMVEIARQRPKVKIYGIDLTKKWSKYFPQNKRELDFCLADINFLPFPESCVDLIISTGVLHGLRDPEGALNECYRVLKSSGKVVIYDPIPLCHKIKSLSLLNKIKGFIYKFYKKIFPGPPKYLPPEKALDIIADTKFKKGKIESRRFENQNYLKIVLKREVEYPYMLGMEKGPK